MTKSIYLAGPIQHCNDNGVGWREKVKQQYSDYEWNDPLDKYNSATDAQYIPRERWSDFDDLQSKVEETYIVEEDKGLIEESDGVLVGWSEVPSAGTPMEVMYTYQLNQLQTQQRPIICWWRDEEESDGFLSPWMEYHSDFVTFSIEESIEWLSLLL